MCTTEVRFNTLWSQVPDAMARYKQLLYYAKKLPPMPEEEKVEVNKVKGCVSQVKPKPQALLIHDLLTRCYPSDACAP